jgi:hypothetical protein
LTDRNRDDRLNALEAAGVDFVGFRAEVCRRKAAKGIDVGSQKKPQLLNLSAAKEQSGQHRGAANNAGKAE